MKRALLLFASILFSLILVEIALTAIFADLGRRGPLEIVPEWQSPYVFRVRPGIPGNTQSLRRSRPIEEVATDSPPRILSYGDSIAEGYGLSEEETYAYRLEDRLSEARGAPVEVLNMRRGHSPTIYTFHLRSDVPRYAPDGVVLQIELLNDTSDEAHVRTSGLDENGLPLSIQSHRYILGWDGHLLAPLSFSGSLLERTKLFAKISRWYGRQLNRMSPNPLFADDSTTFFYSSTADRAFLTQTRLDAGFDRLFDSAAAIHRYLDSHDIRFLLVILPSRHAFANDRFHASARSLLVRAERRAAELGIPYIAPTRAFETQGGVELFMDFCHPTAAGNRVIAKQIEPVLAGWLEIPASP